MNDFAFPPVQYGIRAFEPDLQEVLSDPIVRLVMARDGVSLTDLRDVINEARSRLLMRSLIDAQGAA